MRPLVPLLLTVCASPLFAAPLSPAPLFPVGSTTDTYYGITVADPYRALENGDDPKVQAWSDAQNLRTRAYLDNLPNRTAIQAKYGRLIKAASPAFYALKPAGKTIFAMYSDPAVQQPVLVRLDSSLAPKSRRAIVDPNAIDKAGHTAIDWYEPSPDGSKVAVSISKGGSEDGTLHIFEVASGKEIESPIDRVQYPTGGGSLAWVDENSFFYTRYPSPSAPETERHFNMATYFHTFGGNADRDAMVLGASDGVPRTGEVFLADSGGGATLASVQLGDGGQWQHWLLKPGQTPVKVATYEDRIIATAIAKDGTIYGVSRLGAPRGKVLKLAAPYTGGFAAAPTIIPEQPINAIVDGGEFGAPLHVTDRALSVTRIAGGPNVVTIYDRDGHHPVRVPLPLVSAVREIDTMPSGDFVYSVSTFVTPTYFDRWSAATRRAGPTPLHQTSPVSYADADVTRIFATSKDGTQIPLTIIARKGTRLVGTNPTLLYGYGGYGVNQQPGFSGGFRRLWLDAGGIYVVANIRGGGEYGDEWHTQGNLTHKQNVFDDFAAAGETLIAKGYTSHDKLALQGGSNGGLLMGAVLTQHPDLARAVVSSVGIYDMLRVELDPNGAFNVTEFGTVKDRAQFDALYAYSPLHHVVAGTKYPAVLLLTGANDGRVNPLHSRKFAAALQVAQGDPTHPILLRTSKTSGHGIGSSIDETIFTQTDQLMFLLDQLGMDFAAAGR
ncbi:MAG: prolyl oligopeptidase family serine peptidase [Tepidisphaeraceae bacterium]